MKHNPPVKIKEEEERWKYNPLETADDCREWVER